MYRHNHYFSLPMFHLWFCLPSVCLSFGRVLLFLSSFLSSPLLTHHHCRLKENGAGRTKESEDARPFF